MSIMSQRYGSSRAGRSFRTASPEVPKAPTLPSGGRAVGLIEGRTLSEEIQAAALANPAAVGRYANHGSSLGEGASSVETLYSRRKLQYPMVVWTALAVSAGVHWAVFRYFPTITTPVAENAVREFEVVELAPPEVEIPPAPGRIIRPGAPVISDVPISEEITIAATTFEDFNPAALPMDLPPPPPIPETKPEVWADQPTFTPYTVAPMLKNPDEAAQSILENYPRAMRAAGIGGTVTLWFFLDETGKVMRTLVATTSGYEALDQAASDVAETLIFTPAYNRDTPVKVWVQLPIMFSVRR